MIAEVGDLARVQRREIWAELQKWDLLPISEDTVALSIVQASSGQNICTFDNF